MAKKHNGLLLLGAAAVGAAVGAYLYFKKTDADRFDDDDFDFDDFDDFDDEETDEKKATRSYVPLNLDNAKSEEAAKEEEVAKEDVPADEDTKEAAPTDHAPETETEKTETIEEFFDEEDEL